MRRGAIVLAILAALAVATTSHSAPLHVTCSSSFVQGIVGGVPKCLHAGEFCAAAHEPDYERYGFSCVDGHLRTGGTAPSAPATATPTVVALGVSVVLGARTRTVGCRRGALPDRRCSPGAYYSGLTQPVICAGSFRTSTVRNVSQDEKFGVEREYEMTAMHYGRTIEIDHIVPLELGGSNDAANLFPEPGSGPASYHAKDRLENRLRELVCSGGMSLAAARRGIAVNWERQYRLVFGLVP
jgi:hypothetical protein